MLFALRTLYAAWIIVLFLACPAAAEPPIGTAPVLVARELDGKEFDLSKLRGKVVIIHFWATWCPECHEEMEALDTLYRRHPGNITIIALNTETPKMRKKVMAAMQPFAYGAAMQSDIASSDFGTPQILPVTYIVDKNGVLKYATGKEDKPLTAESLETIIRPLLQ